jgi:acyl-CoA thioesterase-1
MRILFFGDSITQGFWDTDYGGWVQRIRRDYDKQSVKNLVENANEIFNLGVDGDNLQGVIKRLPYEIEARRYLQEPYLLVFAVGMNDTTFRGSEVANTTEQFREDLSVLLASASHYSDKVLFVGLTPVDDELCDPWIHSSSGKSFKNDRILEFEGVIRKFCIEKKVSCVQIFEKFQAGQSEGKLLADGLHPNEDGHQLIADLVKPELDKLIG